MQIWMRLLKPEYDFDKEKDKNKEFIFKILKEDIQKNPEKFIVKTKDELVRKEDKDFFKNSFDGDKFLPIKPVNKTFQTRTHIRAKGEKMAESGHATGTTRTHICAESKKKPICIPIFELKLDANESIDNFSIFYNAMLVDGEKREGKELEILKGENGNWYFIENIRAKYVKNNKGQWRIDSNPVSALIGTVHPGYADIEVKNKQTNELESYKLWVCPAALSKEQFLSMINKLLFIRQDIIMLDLQRKENAKLYLGLDKDVSDWKQVLQGINVRLDRFKFWVDQIEDLPRGVLQSCTKWERYHRIKKINALFIKQYIMNRNKKKYLIESTDYSIDIYEHRVFKRKIEELKEYVLKETEEYIRKMIEKRKRNDENVNKLNESLLDEEKNVIKILDDENSKLDISAIKINTQVEEFSNKIDGCLKLSVFTGLKTSNEEWHMTQILMNDHRYYQIYKNLQNIENILCVSSFSEWEKLFHEKLDKVYEYWILAKMLEMLIKRKWYLDEKDSYGGIIGIFERLTHQDVIIDGRRELELTIKLKHDDAQLEMDLYYNTPINESLKELGTFKGNIGKENYLRPDFLFRVRNKEKEEKVFILDAKYKTGEEAIKQDLVDVCLKKYILRIYNQYNVKVSASFIVHPDDTSEETGRDISIPNEYKGKYITYNASVDKKFKEMVVKEKLKYPDQQIGCFYMLPDRIESDENLETFFAMIFEYYMGATNICWHCGNVGDIIKTKDDGKIIQYQCINENKGEKCGHYWQDTHCHKNPDHQLIKHWYRINNYHIVQKPKVDEKNLPTVDEERKRKAINVICPICGEALN